MNIYLIMLGRALLAYAILALMTKFMGKHQISQLNFSDYIVGITIGSIAANMAFKNNEPVSLFIPALLFFGGIEILSSYLSLKSNKARKFCDGTATILIKDGNIVKENLRKEKINIDELLMQLRQKDIFNLAYVEYAILEIDGSISVLLKNQNQQPTLSDINVTRPFNGIPITIIKDGKLAQEDIINNNIDENWIYEKLNEKQINDISKVFLAQADKSGIVYLDFYNNNISF